MVGLSRSAKYEVPGVEHVYADVLDTATIEAAVAEHDALHGMTRIAFNGTAMWVGQTAAQPGERVRARVLARDVSVTRQQPAETSILNVLPVVLDSVQREHSTALLRLQAGHGLATDRWTLLARITTRSLDALELRPGDALHAQHVIEEDGVIVADNTNGMILFDPPPVRGEGDLAIFFRQEAALEHHAIAEVGRLFRL